MNKHADTSKLTAEDWIILRLLTAAGRNRAVSNDEYNKVIYFLAEKYGEFTVLVAANKISQEMRTDYDMTLVPRALLERAYVAVGAASALGNALKPYALDGKRGPQWEYYVCLGDNNKYNVRRFDRNRVGAGAQHSELIASSMGFFTANELKKMLESAEVKKAS